jgi:hypothetical protein
MVYGEGMRIVFDPTTERWERYVRELSSCSIYFSARSLRFVHKAAVPCQRGKPT